MEKATKILKNDYILLFIWEIIYAIVTLIKWSWDFSLFSLIIRLGIIAIGYYLVISKSIIGGYAGIAIGIIMVINKNVVSVILGLMLILHSLKYLKVIKF